MKEKTLENSLKHHLQSRTYLLCLNIINIHKTTPFPHSTAKARLARLNMSALPWCSHSHKYSTNLAKRWWYVCRSGRMPGPLYVTKDWWFFRLFGGAESRVLLLLLLVRVIRSSEAFRGLPAPGCSRAPEVGRLSLLNRKELCAPSPALCTSHSPYPFGL